jgi:3'-phosphoadenosine 5'-phosphosulfate (PAPS) 3'-phosphatase
LIFILSNSDFVQGINDLQTKADRAAQTYIITELRKRFPLACIIGEEGDDIMECLDGLVSPVIGDGERKEITSHSEILTRSVPETLTSVKEDEVHTNDKNKSTSYPIKKPNTNKSVFKIDNDFLYTGRYLGGSIGR